MCAFLLPVARRAEALRQRFTGGPALGVSACPPPFRFISLFSAGGFKEEHNSDTCRLRRSHRPDKKHSK